MSDAPDLLGTHPTIYGRIIGERWGLRIETPPPSVYHLGLPTMPSMNQSKLDILSLPQTSLSLILILPS